VPEVVLVTMPWDVLASPSLALGTVQRLLLDAGLEVRTRSLKLAWMEHLLGEQRPSRDPITLADYEAVACAGSGLGDWVFAAPPIASRRGVAAYRRLLGRFGQGGRRRKLDEMRRLAPGFLRACAGELLALHPRVVGFTTTFAQNLASLALARLLKAAAPSLRIVFGGANCEGPMGAALQRAHPWVDVVVRGEAEEVAGPLFRTLASGAPAPALPGVCFFDDAGRQVVVPGAPAPVSMDRVPSPHYDDYFRDLAATRFHDTLRATLFLSFEAARGCWWGEVSHCTFCGLNGGGMAFRSKPPERVAGEIVALARRHQVLDLHAVDNILDHRYTGTLLPALAQSGLDLRLFYEVKSNLKRRELEALQRARVVHIQPGIESLSTPILRLMRKGVTALQNLRLLKWSAELGVTAEWNLLYGFPGEPEDEYRRMAELLPRLHHLAPPRAGRLGVHRFSPYHQRPAEHGLALDGAAWYHQFLYDLPPAELAELAHEFDVRYLDGRDPESYAAPCVAAVARWNEAHAAGATLTARRGPGFVLLRDRRDPDGDVIDYVLEGDDAAAYLACDDGARLQAIAARLGLSPARARALLDGLVAEGLVYREGERYLGLALPARPREAGAVTVSDELSLAPDVAPC
jgi:ribosomal peptide maturation radical SAM protein 1